MSEEKLNIVKQEYKLGKTNRRQSNDHHSIVMWFTGLSGSGKSTIANLVEIKLAEKKVATYLLDGDNVRFGLNKDLDFTEEGRKENIRRIGEVSKLMVDAGLVVLTAFISPFRADRQVVRDLLEDDEFVEVFVDTPLEVCEARDVKGLYKKARAGEIPNFTGIDSPYEAPDAPEVHLKTVGKTAEECAEEVVTFVYNKLKLGK